MCKILVFAGTIEGRNLAENLSKLGLEVFVSVATNYGGELISKNENLKIKVGKLNQEEMFEFLNEHEFDCVVDATHPYAIEATNNILGSCNKAKVEYIRLLRGSDLDDRCIYVKSIQECINILNESNSNILLTTGTKDIDKFTMVNNYKERVFVRTLPTVEAINTCYNYGFKSSHVICMQGPFSEDMNYAILSQISAGYMVTKDSGEAGGFLEKITAANRACVKAIVIERPIKEQGYSYNELLLMLKNKYNLFSNKECSDNKSFPFFINIKDKNVVVIGAGKIACRRIETLLNFGCYITIIAPNIDKSIYDDTKKENIKIKKREYINGDCDGADIVLAATNNRAVNAAIAKECREKHIPINVADCKDECSFYFPSIIMEGCVVIAVTASGENHRLAKQTANNIRTLKNGIINFYQHKEDN